MLTDDNEIISTTYQVGQSLAFTQHYDFISVTGQLVAFHGEGLMNWSFTFHVLRSLEHCIPSPFGSDKLDYYTCNL